MGNITTLDLGAGVTAAVSASHEGVDLRLTVDHPFGISGDALAPMLNTHEVKALAHAMLAMAAASDAMAANEPRIVP